MNTIPKGDVPSLTRVQNPIQTLLLIALSIIIVWTLYMVPSWQSLGDPFLFAAVAAAFTVACLWLTRWQESGAIKFERAWLAAFLVGMPLNLCDGLVLGTRTRSEFLDLGGASGIGCPGTGH